MTFDVSRTTLEIARAADSGNWVQAVKELAARVEELEAALREIHAEIKPALTQAKARKYAGRRIEKPLPRAVGKWVLRRIDIALAGSDD